LDRRRKNNISHILTVHVQKHHINSTHDKKQNKTKEGEGAVGWPPPTNSLSFKKIIIVIINKMCQTEVALSYTFTYFIGHDIVLQLCVTNFVKTPNNRCTKRAT